MSRFSKEYKFIIVFISFVLIFAASVVFVGIKNINGAIADDDVWEELNNTVYTSDYSEIFDTDGSKLEALTKEIYGVINGLSADSKKNFLINNPTDSGADELLKKIENTDEINKILEDKQFSQLIEDVSSTVDDIGKRNYPTSELNDMAFEAKTYLADNITQTLKSFKKSSKLTFSNSDVETGQKMFGRSYSDRLRKMNDSRDVFSYSNNQILTALTKSHLFDDDGNMTMRNFLAVNLGIYNSQLKMEVADSNLDLEPSETINVHSTTGSVNENNKQDLCAGDYANYKLDRKYVRFYDHVKDNPGSVHQNSNKTDWFQVDCESPITLGVASAGLTESHKTNFVGIALDSNYVGDGQEIFSVSHLAKMLNEYTNERYSAIAAIITCSVFLLVSIITIIPAAMSVAEVVVAGLLMAAIAPLAETTLTFASVSVYLIPVMGLLFTLGGLAADLYFLAQSLQDAQNLDGFINSLPYLFKNAKIPVINLENYIKDLGGCETYEFCDNERRVLKINNFSFVNESFAEVFPVIHYINPGEEKEQVLEYPIVSSLQHGLADIISDQNNTIKSGAQIWLSAQTKGGSAKKEGDKFIFDPTSPYRAGYVSQGTRSMPDDKLYLVALSSHIEVFMNQMAQYVHENAGIYAQTIGAGGADSGVMDQKNPNVIEKLYFELWLNNYSAISSNDDLLIYTSALINSTNNSDIFMKNEQQNLRFLGLLDNSTDVDDVSITSALISSKTATKESLYKLFFYEMSKNPDVPSERAKSIMQELYRVIKYADRKDLFSFEDGNPNLNSNGYISVTCPEPLLSGDDKTQTLSCVAVRKSFTAEGEMYYINTSDNDIVALGGSSGECRDYEFDGDFPAKIEFNPHSPVAYFNICAKAHLPVGHIAFSYSDTESSTEKTYAGAVFIRANNINEIDCNNFNINNDTIRCIAKRENDKLDQKYTVSLYSEELAATILPSLDIEFNSGETTKEFLINKSEWKMNLLSNEKIWREDGSTSAIWKTSTMLNSVRHGNVESKSVEWSGNIPLFK